MKQNRQKLGYIIICKPFVYVFAAGVNELIHDRVPIIHFNDAGV